MTPGIPGTGIGGLFYLLSAAFLPLRETQRRLIHRVAAAPWRTLVELQLLAAGILAGMWTTGWLLGVLVGTARTHLGTGAATVPHNMWRTATFVLSFATLTIVVGLVELAGLWHRHSARLAARESTEALPLERPSRRAAAGGGRGRWLLLLVFVELASAADPPTAVTQSRSSEALTLARADSTFATGDAPAAVRAYAAVLAIDPANSRATYRLADLQRNDPALALALFRKYVVLEPTDPWGYLSVADMLARLGRFDEALRWSAEALRLAPTERDAVIGRARVLARARRIDASIAAYRAWLATRPSDAEGWQELSRQLARAGRPGEAVRALQRSQAIVPDPRITPRLGVLRGVAAPAFTPFVTGTFDSDGNRILRLGAALELGAAGPTRLGVLGSRAHVGGGLSGADLDALALRATWQPMAAFRIEATGGATRIEPMVTTTPTAPAAPGKSPNGTPNGPNAPPPQTSTLRSSAALIPTGQLRVRWHAPASRLGLDLRGDRRLIDASPLLVANRVVRTELTGVVSVPVAGPFTLRGIGKSATLSDSLEGNHKTTLSGVMAVAVGPAAEFSTQFHQIHFGHPSVSGYFAPWQVQVAEAGTYFELETGSVVLAVDAGAGVQRVAQQRPTFGPWKPAFRLYALLDAPLAPGRDLRLEVESEDSQVATVAATSGSWRYGSVTASLRWALP